MKTFLLKDKKPICKWGIIPDETYFEGSIPEGFSLAVCPNAPYIILDIDRHGDIDGFKNIPLDIGIQLTNHFKYTTKNKGMHVWLKYSGDKELMNKASKLGIDLRTHKGYVKWYLEKDIRHYIDQIKPTSKLLNDWLESLFLGVNHEEDGE